MAGVKEVKRTWIKLRKHAWTAEFSGSSALMKKRRRLSLGSSLQGTSSPHFSLKKVEVSAEPQSCRLLQTPTTYKSVLTLVTSTRSYSVNAQRPISKPKCQSPVLYLAQPLTFVAVLTRVKKGETSTPSNSPLPKTGSFIRLIRSSLAFPETLP